MKFAGVNSTHEIFGSQKMPVTDVNKADVTLAAVTSILLVGRQSQEDPEFPTDLTLNDLLFARMSSYTSRAEF